MKLIFRVKYPCNYQINLTLMVLWPRNRTGHVSDAPHTIILWACSHPGFSVLKLHVLKSVYCVCLCTSTRLLGSLMYVTCLHTAPESHPTGQWRSCSMNQWADIVEADKVLTVGLKDRQGSLKHTDTHFIKHKDPQESVHYPVSRQINIHIYSHSQVKYRGSLY